MAAAILQHHCRNQQRQWQIDSAGTGAWHVGHPADPRTLLECSLRGTSIAHIARQVTSADFHAYDLILGMDHDNCTNLMRLRQTGVSPRLLGDFDPINPGAIIPDPYYDDQPAFAAIYDQIDRCALGLLAAYPPPASAPVSAPE